MLRNILIVLLFSIFTLCAFGQKAEYIGTNKCKSCHNKEEKGAQYKIWSEGKHAKAFETLKSEQAVEVAKKLGLTEAPHESPKCLGCHTTGYEKGGYEVITDEAFWNPAKDDKEGKKAKKRMLGLQGVGCEACHGAGSLYKGKKDMAAVFNGEKAGADVGLLEVTEETCKECHNEKSPTFKAFDYAKQLDEIKHPYPEGMKK